MNIKGYLENKKKYLENKKNIHAPSYNYYTGIQSEYVPKVYNEEGRAYDFFYLRDRHSAHAPYDGTGKYFIFDRYNFGLNTHFYSHSEMKRTMGKPSRKYGMFPESRTIVPKEYTFLEKDKSIALEFDAIFTFDDILLDKIKNAVYMPWCAAPHYGTGKLNEQQHQQKIHDISFLCSNKAQSELHQKRLATARYCHKNNLADVFGRCVSNQYVDLDITLKEYRYSFAIENIQTDYYFTEKITNCFAAQTIPIYLGARKISEFFNTDGIIIIQENDLNHIEDILKQCTKEEYERRRPAILDNYKRVMKYLNMQDYLYENYFV